MRSQFPALNGPFASDDVDNPKITDYSVGRSIIYAAFRWDEADSARKATFNLAKKHRVGFFDVSADDEESGCPIHPGIIPVLVGMVEEEVNARPPKQNTVSRWCGGVKADHSHSA
jgi:hypothetical protein